MYFQFQKIFLLLYMIAPWLTSSRVSDRRAVVIKMQILTHRIHLPSLVCIYTIHTYMIKSSSLQRMVVFFGFFLFRAQMLLNITCVCEQYISKFETMTGTGRATVRTPPRAQRAPTNIPRYVFGTCCSPRDNHRVFYDFLYLEFKITMLFIHICSFSF